MAGFVQQLNYTIVQSSTTVDRSIVRCSVTQQILAIFLQPLTFLWLLSLRQGKESNNQLFA